MLPHGEVQPRLSPRASDINNRKPVPVALERAHLSVFQASHCLRWNPSTTLGVYYCVTRHIKTPWLKKKQFVIISHGSADWLGQSCVFTWVSHAVAFKCWLGLNWQSRVAHPPTGNGCYPLAAAPWWQPIGASRCGLLGGLCFSEHSTWF